MIIPHLSWPSLPSAAALRHAVRLAVVTVLTSEITSLLHLHQGYWAVITAIIVMQGSPQGTLGAAMDRMLATMIGGVVGVADVWIGLKLHIPEAVLLVLATAPFAMLAMQRPSFRFAPVSAAIVVMIGGTDEQALLFSLDRLLEISIGSVIGIATAHLVLPGPARATLRDGTAASLEALGASARGYLTRQSATEIEPLDDQTRVELSRMAAASKEEVREHRIHLSAVPSAEPLLRTIQRLQEDVAILARLMALDTDDADDRAELGTTIQAQFVAAVAFLQQGGEAPSLADIDAAIAAQADGSTLQFALITLRRDLADLGDRLDECLPQAEPRERFRPWMPLGA